MLVDEVDITIKAGKGGDGLMHFFHDRWRPKGGPDGGRGGDGGSVFLQAVSDISRLHQFRHEKDFKAAEGEPGGPNQRTGKNGEDLILLLPIGSLITYDNGTEVELTTAGQTIMAAKGGHGGQGNYYYRSSTNQTPQEHQAGSPTLVKHLHIKLKLIADIGLVGLPNAGKTSLLNELTTANARVANYAFTTLEPNLGVTGGGNIIADIPGLIEGASDGKGLGYKFLKHIERTKIIVHCVASDSVSPLEDYKTVRKELENYSSELLNKKELIIITKSDLVDATKIKQLQKSLKADLVISVLDDASIKSFSDLISKELNKESDQLV